MVWFVKLADVIRRLSAVNEADAAGPSHTSVIQSMTRDEYVMESYCQHGPHGGEKEFTDY